MFKETGRAKLIDLAKVFQFFKNKSDNIPCLFFFLISLLTKVLIRKKKHFSIDHRVIGTN